MNDFAIMGYAAAGMEAQHDALDIAARNVALAQTASPQHPVHTLIPDFEAAKGQFDFAWPDSPDAPMGAAQADDDVNIGPIDDDDAPASPFSEPQDLPGSVHVAGVKVDPTPQYAVDSVHEMVNVLDAQRAYEANTSVFNVGRRLIEKTVALGQQ